MACLFARNCICTKVDKRRRIVFGIKGTSTLSTIVDLPLGAPIDYMHCVLEGVVKRLLNLWTNSSNHGNPFRRLNIIDLIQKHRSHWKVSQLVAVLFSTITSNTSPPALFAPLCPSCYRFTHQPKLTAGEMLDDFVRFLPELYDCVLNTHLLSVGSGDLSQHLDLKA